MKVIWLSGVRQALKETVAYGKEVFGEKAARNFWSDVYSYDAYLASYPYLGRIEESLAGLPFVYRSIVVHQHYKLIYRVDEDAQTVYIAALWDTRRNPNEMKSTVQSQ